ncbi:transporter substrate-binding domain-containing protein [Variovorax sp. J22R133]|uniref:transporter substrate-binding domain-containing protein n=1 Tax=Variovorax brevis TaxID=3053503 RepID=UPI0025784CC3|nr:transporter substrate-binding domain-containing protein [Variovorax sp. J22R133]MDM0110592.1 transporter substrate-binding domain-containing protein [Variovorax sp. J22R133]
MKFLGTAMRDKAARWPRRWLMSLLAIFFLVSLSAAAEVLSPKETKLVGFTNLPRVLVNVSEEEQRWLSDHKVITVGVVPHDFVPFDLIDLDNSYEGISADYLEAITSALELQVRIKVFRTREEASAALAGNEVDVLGTVPLSLADRSKVALSTPYYSIRHVEVTSATRGIDRNGDINVGYVAGHASLAAMKDAYPNARLIPYATPFLGVGSMVNNKVDLFVGISAGVSYLMDHFQVPNIRITNFGEEVPDTMHFGFRPESDVLRQVFDRAMEALPQRARTDIKTRWAPNYEAAERLERVNFSESERQWIAAHPVVRYSTLDDFMPFVFLDHSGRYAGLTLQVIDRISAETGLSFEAVPERGSEAGNVDMLSAVIRGQGLPPGMAASNAYFRDHWVIVARMSEQDFLRVESLAGKRIAYFSPNSVAQTIKAKVPNVTLIQADSVAETYEFVAQGRADVTIGNIDTANYLIAQGYVEQLKVAGSVDDAPVDIAFGVRSDEPELLSIVNKALEGIPAEEIRRIRSNGMFFSRPGTDWSTYVRWLYVFGGGLLLCLALFAVWNRSLKKEVNRRHAAEVELNDQLEFQRAMLEGIPHAIGVRDAQARLLFCNAAFERLFQVPRDLVVGKTLPESNATKSDPAAVMAIHQNYLRLLADGTPISEDFDVVTGA